MVDAVRELLAARAAVVLPEWAIRDVVEAQINIRFPNIPADRIRITLDEAESHAAGIVDGLLRQSHKVDIEDMPAVLDQSTVGSTVMALGAVVHCASLNLDQSRMTILGILTRAAVSLTALGHASRIAHASGTGAVLVAPDTIRAARTVINDCTDLLRAGGWHTVDDTEADTHLLALLADASHVLTPSRT